MVDRDTLAEKYRDTIIDAVDNIGWSYMPNQQKLKVLYDLYKEFYPRDKMCMTCRGDRSRVFNFFKQLRKQWPTNQ